MEFSFRSVHGNVIDLHGAKYILQPHIRDYGLINYFVQIKYIMSMSDEEQTPDEVEEIAINDEPVESAQEEEVKPGKAKSKAKAKSKIKITKEPVETIVEETVIEEPIIEEKPKRNNIKRNGEMS